MFYPKNNIDELISDTLINSIDENQSSDYKNRIGYFTNNRESLKQLNKTMKQNNQLENNSVEQNRDCTKGILPLDFIMFPVMPYSYKGGDLPSGI